MNDLPTLFAAMDYEQIRGYVIVGIRIIACFFAAVAGWFVASPILRGLYRLYSPRKGIPFRLLFPLRLVSACALATVVWFVSLHFGGSGWGFGGGGPGGDKTGGPGDGKGTGSDSGMVQGTTLGNNHQKTAGDPAKAVRQIIEIEIVPQKDKNKCFYLVKSEPNAKTWEEIEKSVKELVKDKNGHWEAHITFNADDRTPTIYAPAVSRLLTLLDGLMGQKNVHVAGGRGEEPNR
jgi:hypothetical protein